ncbi:MAG: Gfo/Idh/MocA family protein, partial [Planctomycetota bacterium]
MKKVRFGIIGCGGMGRGHARQIADAGSRKFCVTAVADTVAARAEALAAEHNVACFTDPEALMESGLVDAVLIATPHYDHPVLTIQAARRKLHVLCEKPIASSIGPARAMVAECRKRRVAFGVMFQHRNRPEMVKMKQMIERGAIGDVFRIQMICSTWYRTQSYYDSGTWRGTWNGEGGGVLINQAPHSLDLFLWMAGRPKRVVATVDTRHHRIEVENTANAIVDYGHGRTGYIYATTAEVPGMEQLLVAGDRGALIAEGGRLRHGRVNKSIRKHLMTARRGFGTPETTWKDVPLPKTARGHIAITRAFVDHVLKGTGLKADGTDGVNELELSNAVYLSGFKSRPVEL